MNRNMLTLTQEKANSLCFRPNTEFVEWTTCPSRAEADYYILCNPWDILEILLTAAWQCRNRWMRSPSAWNIGKVITNDACKILVQALVTTRLDYGNALLQGLPQVLIERLQRIQNYAARLITGSRKSEHITPVLRELLWLPVKYRLRFKVNTFTYKFYDVPLGVLLMKLLMYEITIC